MESMGILRKVNREQIHQAIFGSTKISFSPFLTVPFNISWRVQGPEMKWLFILFVAVWPMTMPNFEKSALQEKKVKKDKKKKKKKVKPGCLKVRIKVDFYSTGKGY